MANKSAAENASNADCSVSTTLSSMGTLFSSGIQAGNKIKTAPKPMVRAIRMLRSQDGGFGESFGTETLLE